MKVINTEKLPIKMWLNEIEDGALAQLKNLANLPFLYKWVCAMSDCHQGYGMPIGGVIVAWKCNYSNCVGSWYWQVYVWKKFLDWNNISRWIIKE